MFSSRLFKLVYFFFIKSKLWHLYFWKLSFPRAELLGIAALPTVHMKLWPAVRQAVYTRYMRSRWHYVIDRLLLNWNKVNAGQFSCRLCTCCRPQPKWSSCSISPARDMLPVKNCLFMKLLETIDYVVMFSCGLPLLKESN